MGKGGNFDTERNERDELWVQHSRGYPDELAGNELTVVSSLSRDGVCLVLGEGDSRGIWLRNCASGVRMSYGVAHSAPVAQWRNIESRWLDICSPAGRCDYERLLGEAVGDEETWSTKLSYWNHFYHVVWVESEPRAQLLRRISLSD